MKTYLYFLYILLVVTASSCTGKNNFDRDARISLVTSIDEKKVDISINDRYFTSFRWPDSVYKPILYPVFTSSGTEVTRGFPLNPRPGETFDHPHQVGLWLTYGNANRIDFWSNGRGGDPELKAGEIRHTLIERIQSRNGEGLLITSAKWLIPGGKTLLNERTEYHFFANGADRIIDRITTLTAGDTAVVFKDTKEGMFGIRVARQLEMPSPSGVYLIDSAGVPSNEKDTLNLGVSGSYLSSEGLKDNAVWGTRAEWMHLSGKIGDELISIVICDHPENPGYPTYWHARGYGLFAANPLGWKDFTSGKESLNFTIPAKKSATFRYRVLISSGSHPDENKLNEYFTDFSKKYK